jgi:hypothetical protein
MPGARGNRIALVAAEIQAVSNASQRGDGISPHRLTFIGGAKQQRCLMRATRVLPWSP